MAPMKTVTKASSTPVIGTQPAGRTTSSHSSAKATAAAKGKVNDQKPTVKRNLR